MSQEQQKVEEPLGLTTPAGSKTTQDALDGTMGETSINSKMSDSGQLVPVSEAIKYRKRAQMAEQQVEQLKQELSQRQQAQQDVQARLERIQQDSELTQALVRAGAIDIEAALLLVQKKMSSSEKEQDVNRVIENLRRERPYLFFDAVTTTETPWADPTATVRGQNNGRANALARLAQQVRRSGNRKDMQEYLRMRRALRR